MSLFFAEMRKVWGGRIFPVLLAVLAAANLLLLWMGTRPTATQPPAGAYRAVSSELSGLSMEEKGEWLGTQLTDIESLLKLSQYYQEMAWGGYGLEDYREQNAALFNEYDQRYKDKNYSLYTGSLNGDYRLFSQLESEYSTVAAYGEFLTGVQAKANQLAGISIFQNAQSGYDLKNIEITAKVYAGLQDTAIDYHPQKGLYTAISYRFTDLILLAAMLLLALLLVRQERDSGLLSLIRSLPAGRLQTALAKLLAFAASLLAVLMVLYGVNLIYCKAAFGLGPLNRTIQSLPFLMRCTMQITVRQYLLRFLLAKWLGAFVLGLWVMLAALAARRASAGWLAALALPLAMYGIRAAIPATSHWNVIKYANLVSLLQTNELLGNYRNLYWFGSPIALPLVEWTAALILGAAFAAGFLVLFCRGQLPAAPKRGFSWGFSRKTRPVTVPHEEARKLFTTNGAALFLAAFLIFGIYQGVNAESYIDADEIYYAYYMKHISAPWSEESRTWLLHQGEEFAPLLEVQRRIQKGEISSDAALAYSSLQQKYDIYTNILSYICNDLPAHPGAWPVYESGYEKLFGFSGSSDVQDTLFAGLLCALCFSGLFSMERKGGMDEILCATPLGRRRTVQAKLRCSAFAALLIAAGTALPHIWQVMRDYGLPAMGAPACSIRQFGLIPRAVTLSDVFLFWFLCRFAACLCMGWAVLWLGHRLGEMLPALFIGAAALCLPALLCLSGMKNGIEWLGFYPLFHAASLLQIQGYNALGSECSYSGFAFFWLAAALCFSWILYWDLVYAYECKGQ